MNRTRNSGLFDERARIDRQLCSNMSQSISTLVAHGIEYAFQTARILRVGIVHLDEYKQSLWGGA